MSQKITKEIVCPSLSYFFGECYPGDHYDQSEREEAVRQQEEWFDSWKRSVPMYILAFRILNEIFTILKCTRRERAVKYYTRGKTYKPDKECPFEEKIVLKISDFLPLDEFEIGIIPSDEFRKDTFDGINGCIELAGVAVNDVETIKDALVKLEKIINRKWVLERRFFTVDTDNDICLIDVKKFLGEGLYEEMVKECKTYYESDVGMAFHSLFVKAMRSFGGYNLSDVDMLYHCLNL